MSKQLEIVLKHSGLLAPDVLARCVDLARRRNLTLMEMVLKEGQLTEDNLAEAFAKYLRLPRVKLATSVSEPEALKKVPEKIVRKHTCLPLSIEGKTLVLAMADPTDYQALQDVEFASALSAKPVVATRTEVQDAIEERYAAEDRIGSFLANVPEVQDMQIIGENQEDLTTAVDDDRNAAEVAPVVKMVNLVVYDAIKSGASDLHIEPTLHDVCVRMRVDGVLRDYTHTPKWLHSPLITRLKVLAKLDIAERRLPQDGRINVQYQGRTIDIRVSTLPTHFGEKAVLRVLGGSTVPKVDRLGLNPDQSAMLEAAIMQPQGIILVTGPTGSGKSTTLYALLQRRKSPEVNIITVEDPIEYQLAGINQVQVNTKAGLSFASVLRSILRQDPDVILVGEMRDQETSEVAFQAAMTGHLVLSTLHTNSAVAAVSRLFDINVDPSILSTSLTLVIAQRLVRRVCDQCREKYQPDVATMQKVGLTAADGMVYRGKGCQACSGTGYSGRLGIYEFFKPTTTTRKLIHERVGEVELRNAARQGGMKTLREDALDKVRQGLTSPDEVLRVVQVDDNEVPCPNCRALIEPDFAVCPYCLYTIRRTCQSCGQNLKPDWKACPYCNAQAAPQTPPVVVVTQAVPAPRAELVPEPDRPHAPSAPAGGVEKTGRKASKERNWPASTQIIDFDSYAPPEDSADRISAAAARLAQEHKTSPHVETAAAAQARGSAAEDNMDQELAHVDPVVPVVEPEPLPPPPPPVVATVPAPVPDPASAPVPAPETVPAPAKPADGQPVARRLKVLVVDDDEDIRKVVSYTLRKLPVAVDVSAAIDGRDAVEQAMADPPDLIILDVMMPRMDGFEACAQLRKHVRTAFVPILMLTASADESSRTKGYLVGTDDYMSKPFLPPDLNLRVTRLLRRTYGI